MRKCENDLVVREGAQHGAYELIESSGVAIKISYVS